MRIDDGEGDVDFRMPSAPPGRNGVQEGAKDGVSMRWMYFYLSFSFGFFFYYFHVTYLAVTWLCMNMMPFDLVGLIL